MSKINFKPLIKEAIKLSSQAAKIQKEKVEYNASRPHKHGKKY